MQWVCRCPRTRHGLVDAVVGVVSVVGVVGVVAVVAVMVVGGRFQRRPLQDEVDVVGIFTPFHQNLSEIHVALVFSRCNDSIRLFNWFGAVAVAPFDQTTFLTLLGMIALLVIELVLNYSVN